MIAASDRAGMFLLGVLCGSLAVVVVYMVLTTLSEVKHGIHNRRFARRQTRRLPLTFNHPDPIIRKAHRDHDHR